MTVHLYGLMRRLSVVFGSALILMFFSEFYFLNEEPVLSLLTQTPSATLASLSELTVYYALFAYLFLATLSVFKVRRWRGLFLAGCVFGWATEGLIIPLVYEAVPFSLIFPSVSWHAVVDVLVGWYLVRRVMRLNRLFISGLMFIILGLVWGIWATWFWGEAGVLAPLPPLVFLYFVVVVTFVWVLGMLLLDRFSVDDFEPPKWELMAILGISVVLFIITGIAFIPLPIVLAVLWIVTLLALRCNARQVTTQDVLGALHETEPAWWNYLLVGLTPLIAASIYPLFYFNGVGLPTEEVTFYLLLAGTLGLFWALARSFGDRGTSDKRNVAS